MPTAQRCSAKRVWKGACTPEVPQHWGSVRVSYRDIILKARLRQSVGKAAREAEGKRYQSCVWKVNFSSDAGVS